tara:strand:+ start:8341 stop:8580 length:240 start_codon:yes stop_codon:yes gene_type:complete
LPPRKEWAPLWYKELLNQLLNVKLILLLGAYAQKYYLENQAKRTLTETVAEFEIYWTLFLVLSQHSPRNNRRIKKNPWF